MTINKELIDRITGFGLKPPGTLTVAITGGCNLNCPHCLLDCRDSVVSPVPADILKRLICDFFELGGKRLWLTGGEPLIHPDWPEILGFAFAQTDLAEIGLQTNLILMTEEDAARLLSLPVDRLSLQVSLDGACAETNDIVRGKGSFDKAMKALRMLSSKGLGKCTSIAFTEMRHNYHELPDAIDLVRSLGLKHMVSNTLIKAGRSLSYDWIILPAEDQIRALIEKYCIDPVFHNQYEKYGNISAIEWFKGMGTQGMGTQGMGTQGMGTQGMGNPADPVCNCISTPYISADGKMYPCAMYLNDSLAVDRVHGISLEAAIAKGLPKWAELPKISRYRSKILSDCKECPGHTHCSGGCPGRADAVHGNALTIEDRCRLRKTVYSIQP